MTLELAIGWNPYKENCIIVGSAQQGKTNTAVLIAKLFYPNFNQIIFTPHHQSKLISLNPTSVIHNPFDVKGSGLEIVVPQISTKEFFSQLCERVFELRNVHFMIDEIHNFVTKYQIPQSLRILVENCNNRNIGYTAIFQRPQRVENSILSNSDHRFCYLLDLPNDYRYMKEFIGIEIDKFMTGEIPKYYGLYKRKGDREAYLINFPAA